MFPPPLDIAIGSVVKRLDRFIGPAEAEYFSESEEPEGYDGISRRGNFDRLLISEWLLAEELPDEFFRRSTNAEQSFLELARKSPAGERNLVVLLDSGPNQLGSPRLVHLATLIVLASRAEAIGANLRWGLLQDKNREIHEGLTQDGVQSLIKSRSIYEVSNEDVEEWMTQFSDKRSLWVIGGSRTMRVVVKHQPVRLQVDDLLEPDERAVSVEYTKPARKLVKFVLPLPAEGDCIRLLRAPFAGGPRQIPKPREYVHEAATSQLLSNGKDNFFHRGCTLNVVYSYGAGRSARGGQLGRKQYEARSTKNAIVIAAGIRCFRYAAVIVTGCTRTSVMVETFGGPTNHQMFEVGLPFELDYFQTQTIPPFSLCVQSPETEPSVWTLIDDTLISIPLTPAVAPVADVVETSVSYLFGYGFGVFYCKDSEKTKNTVLHRRTNKSKEPPTTMDLRHRADKVFVAFNSWKSHPVFGVVAFLSATDNLWRIADKDSTFVVPLRADESCIGVVGRYSEDCASALLVLSSDKQRLRLVSSNNWSFDLPVTGAPIYSVAAAPNCVVAYESGKGELTMFWVGTGEWLRAEPGETLLRRGVS